MWQHYLHIVGFWYDNAPRERESAKYEQQSSTFNNNNNLKQVQWKGPLEEVHQIENPKQLLKRPTYIINIIYNNHGIYLSKHLQPEKPMYNL
jgi:hypothetical protein